MERYLNLSLPFGLVPTEATIGSYRQKPSARALHRVYSVEATFGSEKRCFHRYETGGEPWPVSAASSHQLSPHWHKASGSETHEKMLHSVAICLAADFRKTTVRPNCSCTIPGGKTGMLSAAPNINIPPGAKHIINCSVTARFVESSK